MLNILILCTGNSARSILLEAILNHEGAGRVQAFSAGSHPTGAVHPQSLTLLRGKGYDVTEARSKSWDEFAKPEAPPLDVVLTVCASAAGETCPIWPRKGGAAPLAAHWGVEDPAAAVETDWEAAFETAYRVLHKRALAFLTAWDKSKDRAALRRALDMAGEIT